MNPNPIVVFAIAWLVTWGFLALNARAQDRLLIAKLSGTNIGQNIVRLTWHDSNVTSVVVATNLTMPPKWFLYRDSTNPTAYVITVYIPVEHKAQLFSTAPKFIGAIPEAK